MMQNGPLGGPLLELRGRYMGSLYSSLFTIYSTCVCVNFSRVKKKKINRHQQEGCH